MLAKTEIEEYINELVKYLANIQNNDGSFEIQFIYSEKPELGWISWGNAPFDTASIMISLLSVEQKKTDVIFLKACSFLLNQSLDKRVWQFSPGQGYELPYDIDATALCSFVLEKCGYTIKNKPFIDNFIDAENNYKTWLFPSVLSSGIPLITRLKIIGKNNKALRLRKLNISKYDREFSMNSNVLLYVGKTKKNEKVWGKTKQDFTENTIECRYYDKYYSIYAYARLYAHSKNKELLIPEEILSERIHQLYGQIVNTTFSLKYIFLANAVLLFGIKLLAYNSLFETCFSHIKEKLYQQPAPYYSSNLIYDKNPDNAEPVNYFGSSALTCSLYIEFLNHYHNAITR